MREDLSPPLFHTASEATAPGKRLAAVWTRHPEPAKLAGRPRVMQAIREVMESNYQVHHWKLSNLLESRSPSACLHAAAAAIRSLGAGQLPSCQCLLFSNRSYYKSVIDEILAFQPDVLYCDGVRTFSFLQALLQGIGARSLPRIVVDFDDLMSRRMEALGASGVAPSFGYLQSKVPARLRKAMARGPLPRALASYERRALLAVEAELGRRADAITLISTAEAAILSRRLGASGGRAEVHVIPPAAPVLHPPQAYPSFTRFIFLGSDVLPQNRLAITYIHELWRTLRPQVEIHIFGDMVERWPATERIRLHGYAASLNAVYEEGSVLFAPAMLAGGVKTKVLEALAHGCAVVGNPLTFESIPLEAYPLCMPDAESLAAIVCTPQMFLPQMREAARLGQLCLRAHLSPSGFARKWRHVLG